MTPEQLKNRIEELIMKCKCFDLFPGCEFCKKRLRLEQLYDDLYEK